MSNHRYSPEFKDEAVRQIIEAGHSVTDVSARLALFRTDRCRILTNRTTGVDDE